MNKIEVEREIRTQNPKKKIRTLVGTLDTYAMFDSKPIKTIMQVGLELANKYGPDVEMDADHDGDFDLWDTRLETDDEYNKRISVLVKDAVSKLEKEKRQYLKLKAKFEPELLE